MEPKPRKMQAASASSTRLRTRRKSSRPQVPSLPVGAPVHLKDELRTGANARLQVTFLNETQLTLGEHASVVIDRYVYDPDSGADHWTNMGFCCSKGKSRSRTRQGASCWVNLDRVPIFPRRSTRPALPLRGPPGRSPAPLRPSPCTDGE